MSPADVSLVSTLRLLPPGQQAIVERMIESMALAYLQQSQTAQVSAVIIPLRQKSA